MGKTEFDSLNKKIFTDRGYKIVFRKGSKTSEGFLVSDDRIKRRNFIKEAFCLKEEEKFDKKYEEASTGSGKPYKDYDALKSSALCALLSFYRISDLKIGEVFYDKAYFEVQNIVIPNYTPSNMDVVLVSEDNKTILFLECKFSEYISNGKQEVSNAYLDSCDLSRKLYELVIQNKLGTKTTIEGKEKFFFKTKSYSEGTKQVISHLVGITSFINSTSGYEKSFKFYGDDDERKQLYKMEFNKVIFREVLFELKGYESKLNAYLEFSEKVRKLFIKSGLINDIEFAPATTYQEIFKSQKLGNIDDIVASFYNY